MTYYILIRYYYYEGTFCAPDDGPMTEGCTSRRRLFETVQEARDYLEKFGVTRQLSPQNFCEDGVYVTAHGEYERPDYWIRKCRTNNKPTIQGG
jgi:hypothetical protein